VAAPIVGETRWDRSFSIRNLHERHRALTVPIAGTYEEAASVCLQRHHTPPADVILADNGSRSSGSVNWTSPDQRTLDAWANETIRGTLRALHLDKDWLEVATTDNPPQHLKIEEAGDVLDDVVGPMVNRLVHVSVIRRGKRLVYQDIELEE
jgi:hypothetical protein